MCLSQTVPRPMHKPEVEANKDDDNWVQVHRIVVEDLGCHKDENKYLLLLLQTADKDRVLQLSRARVNKEGRAAGVLGNFSEGQKYAEHGLRKFVRNKTPQIMPSINSFSADPK